MRFLQLSVVQGCAASRGLCCLGGLWPRCLAADGAVLALCLQVCSPPCVSAVCQLLLFVLVSVLGRCSNMACAVGFAGAPI